MESPKRIADNMSKHMRGALKGLNNDVSRDVKLDDKSGCFVVADKNSLNKLTSVEEVIDRDTDDVMKDIESTVGEMVFDMIYLCKQQSLL